MQISRVHSAGDIEIACRVEGTGPAVVLLHGFPDLGVGWRHQSAALAAAGFRAVCPDLRGYGASSRPAALSEYALTKITDDVIAVITSHSSDPVMLVGHDWGGVIAWYVAMQRPDLLRRLIIMNAPHPAAYRREVARFSSQIVRSWYAGFFQLPLLPEMLLRTRHMRLLDRVWRHGPARDAETLEVYRAAFSQPGAITAALNYYRAAIRYRNPKGHRIGIPVNLLWGDRDRYLVKELTQGLESRVPLVEIEHFPGAGHWLHHDEGKAVNDRLVALAGR